jgi:DNA polymerase-1
MSKTALIDGDMIVYKAAAASEVETRWEDGIWTLHSVEDEAVGIACDLIQNIVKTLRADDCMLFFTVGSTFRHELFPNYKSNRINKRKPLGLSAIRDRLGDDYYCMTHERVEADDLIGIFATGDPDAIAVSGDKDFATLPCDWFNNLTGERKTHTVEEANYNHLVQTLTGDAVDGFEGIKGVGPVTAKRHLDKHGATWESVVSLYEKKGLTEEDALLTARLSYILRHEDYNTETKEIQLWNPRKLLKQKNS